jgi:Flp pilus assembly protein TadD
MLCNITPLNKAINMRFTLIILVLGLSLPVFSQTPEQLKEAQEMLKKMTPEQKKMMEQMGLNPDPMSVIPKGTDVTQLVADHNNYIPPKNNAGIAAAGKTVTTSTLPSFITSTNNTVNAKLDPKIKSLGDKTFQAMSAAKKSAQVIGNNAATIWMAGQPLLALYVMGKACQMEAGNANLTGNYASMLSMCGMPELAIPILNKLNAEIPRNSTILNNLGQAWFGLGELNKARKYLDSTIAMYAYHPQATQTVAAIEESKGNTAAAIDLMKKSIAHAYTKDKENKLRKLGVKLKASDLKFSRPFKPDSDPLGLHEFKAPSIPKSGMEQVQLAPEWANFLKEIGQKIDQLSQKIWDAGAKDREEAQAVAEAMKNNRAPKTNHRDNPAFWSIGNIMLNESAKDGGTAFRLKSAKDALDNFAKVESQKFKAQYLADLKEIGRKEELASKNTKKEGGDEGEFLCKERLEAHNKFLAAAGTRYEEVYRTYLKQLSLSLNEEVYWKQYMQWPDDYEETKLNAQIAWLAALSAGGFPVVELDKPIWDVLQCAAKTQEVPAGYKLADFNVINCNIKSELYLFVGSIKIDCNVMTTKFKLGPFEGSLKQDMNTAGFIESYRGGTVKVSAGPDVFKKDIEGLAMGMVQADFELKAGVEGSIELEFDESGFADISISGSAEAVNNEVEMKFSLVSGKVSVETQTMFENIPR